MMSQTFTRWCLGVLLLLAASLGCTRVHAQGRSSDGAVEQGRKHFKRGVDYYRDGDLDGAFLEFKRAYSIAPNYRLLYNLGRVSSELRQYVEARRYVQRYLNEGGNEIDAARRLEAEALLSKLASRIATLKVSCNLDGADILIDDLPIGRSPLPGAVEVAAGSRRISAAIKGGPSVERVVEVVGGEKVTVVLELTSRSDGELPASAPRVARVKGTEASSGKSAGLNMTAVWLGVGAGALAVGAGVTAYLGYHDTSSYQAALKRKTTEKELDSLRDRAETKALIADILLGATAVTATITLVVALSGDDEASERQSDVGAAEGVRLTLGPQAVGVAGHF